MVFDRVVMLLALQDGLLVVAALLGIYSAKHAVSANPHIHKQMVTHWQFNKFSGKLKKFVQMGVDGF